MRTLFLLCAVSALSGCAWSTPRFLYPEPLDLRCSALCETPCGDVAPLPVAPDGTASPDDVLAALVQADGELDRCEVARASCVSCIHRGREAGIIK